MELTKTENNNNNDNNKQVNKHTKKAKITKLPTRRFEPTQYLQLILKRS